MGKLTGKVAVVTGASKGIGAGIATALGREGAKVVVNYASDKAGAERVAAEIKSAGGDAVAVGGSVARSAEVANLFAEAKKLYGKVDVLVNNAGVYAFSPVEAISEEEIDRIFDTNVKGLLLATQAALPLFPADGGSVINIGSVVSETTPPGSSVYSGTKGAVDAITRVLARELGPRKIRANAVNPGFTITEGVQTAGFEGSDFANAAIAETPLGRAGRPDDIADVVAFLASDEARWVTGALLQAGGGLR
jgi:3-oxoacyl-[acyl-carrier protein] reductase